MRTQTQSLELSHFPVMLSEIIKICSPVNNGLIVDCTFGGGGYSKEFLKIPKTKIVGFDRDKYANIIANKLKEKFKKRFRFYQSRFSELDTILEESADIIIFDLGLSSIQLNDFERGFSFKSKLNLDMRMGLSDISAKDVINTFSETQLKLIFKILGEEKEASKIAKNIVLSRLEKKITRVDELVKIIEKSKKKNFSHKINPCTKTFQALRIFVNKEITELLHGITNATKILKPGGKILVVSFHSIEDKIVKYFFSNFSKSRSKPSRYLPYENNENYALFENYLNKPIKPSKKEIILNNPSRSAKLRYAVRSHKSFFYPKNLFEKFKKYLDIEAINAKT